MTWLPKSMSKEHKWFTLPPDTTTSDATVYEVCDCGAKRMVITNYDATAKMTPATVWINGPYEHEESE